MEIVRNFLIISIPKHHHSLTHLNQIRLKEIAFLGGYYQINNGKLLLEFYSL